MKRLEKVENSEDLPGKYIGSEKKKKKQLMDKHINSNFITFKVSRTLAAEYILFISINGKVKKKRTD